ncbi:MAG: hypothetical protein HKN91_05680 [Acidimicrobiia bacterium]|nr:hypothetical protein [Acidimicrobiia bacterium]
MNWKRRALVPILSFALIVGACGDEGETPEQREGVVQMLERLGKSRILASCITEQLDGTYTAEDLQPMIDSRGDFSTVDFQLLEDLVLAERKCNEDDS